jgi:outer membrane protein assembly factor BamB
MPGPASNAGDWPAYRADAQRSGYTAESLPADLALRWSYQALHSPQPAWSGRDTRMPFDAAYHPVVADGAVFFGSSADDRVYALDAATGGPRWSFLTDGPVRFPPAVWQGRVLVTSDDGHLYCLAAKDGQLLWKLRGGRDGSRLLGNGRMVSRWPARGGPAVADGIVYFAAGIWPSEGIFLYAVEIESGKVLWCNDQAGSIEMPQPHGTAVAKSGISAQGNMVVSGNTLLVPTGRAVPALFDRRDGRLLQFHLQQYRADGGSEVVATDAHFINGNCVFNLADGHEAHDGISAEAVAFSPQWLIYTVRDNLAAVDRTAMWAQEKTTDRKGNEVMRTVLSKPAWTIPTPVGSRPLAVTGKQLVVGNADGIAVLDLDTRQAVFAAPTEGAPRSVAIAGSRLFVATDKGVLHCFAEATGEEPKRIHPALDAVAAEEPRYAEAADEIVRQSGITEGYCLDLGCGDGSLTLALARRTNVKIYAVDPDPANVAAARHRLETAGLYGVRATVHLAPLDATDYPNYFANLIVSQRSLTEALSDGAVSEAGRMLRPFGGVACVGAAGAMKKTVRGELEGAGTWTHQYCDPANTNCSPDTLVHGRLGMLWFADLNFAMPSRHGRGPAPLFLDGRLFVEGIDALRAVDAYNGRVLWEYPLPTVLRAYDQEHLMGTAGTNSNMCISRQGLFVRTGSKCLRIEPASGKLVAEYEAPKRTDGQAGVWGAVFIVGDMLFGTLSNTEHVVNWRFKEGDMSTQFTESTLLFAIDISNGQVKWQFAPERSIRNNTIAIGGGRVFLIDRPPAVADRLDQRAARRRGEPAPPQPTGTLVALAMADGKAAWKADDVFGTALALSEAHDVLVMSYQDTRFKLDSETGRRLAAFRASDGTRLWNREGEEYRSRLILNDRTIYAEPGAWDLLTGERKNFQFSRSYGCGTLAGAKNLLVYRSATLGYTDLADNHGNENYGGIRPGCWINTLPVGGLVLMPDATDRCTCSYLIKSSIALEPLGRE